MRAVHFGAGNIGRGFVGLLLAEGGYELTFADVADQLIEQLQAADSYQVHEVGDELRAHDVRNFSAINSAKDAEALTAALASADVITTAVGVSILKYVAPAIAAGIAARPEGAPRVAVMACENAIGATDILETEVRSRYEGDDLDERAVFANTAVDRIVPAQDPGLDVTVENYYEWAIETGPFGDQPPEIPGVTWVPDLAPYIERKLFTVNTGHATTAYFGYLAGVSKISDALADPDTEARVAAVLAETRALLVAKYGFDEAELEAYAAKIMRRFAVPARHGRTRGTIAAAQALPQRPLRRPGVAAGRTGDAHGGPVGGDGCGLPLRLRGGRRGRRIAAAAGRGAGRGGCRHRHRARTRPSAVPGGAGAGEVGSGLIDKH